MTMEGKVDSYWARIYIAGPISEIEQVCREFVLEVGLCVTVTPTKYIYTGGEETGVIVELINYPRFPSTPDEVNNKALTLADKIMVQTCQGSYTIVTPDETVYYSRRDEFR